MHIPRIIKGCVWGFPPPESLHFVRGGGGGGGYSINSAAPSDPPELFTWPCWILTIYIQNGGRNFLYMPDRGKCVLFRPNLIKKKK